MRDKLDKEGVLVESSGKAFLASAEFQKWSRDTESRRSILPSNFLFCHGKRM